MKINGSLNDIPKIIRQLEKYKNDLEEKRIIFIRNLMEVGINVANAQLGEFAGMVVFEKTIDEDGGVIIATDGQKLVKTWYADKALTKERSYEVSPLLLSEFGSGWLADSFGISGVGQGTMPGQTHAFDKNGWYWYDEDGTKHHSYGEKPTRPMHNAALEMMQSIERIAREVYGVTK